MNENETPEALVELGFSFWRAKVLHSAVELGVFTHLATGPKTAAALSAELELSSRGARDFYDALVALKLLTRSGDTYANSPLAARFLDAAQATYLGGLFEMASDRLYPVWGKLSEALRTGKPQNEAQAEPDYYANLCSSEERLRTFLRGMTGLSMTAAAAIAEQFPWQNYKTFADIGGAQGLLATRLAQAHPHLSGVTLDLEPVAPFFQEYVGAFGLEDRLRFQAGDFFQDDLPRADVLVFGHVLHNWSLEQKKQLVQKSFAALQPGGALIVYEALIDDERRTNLFGLLMSLNMLLVTSEGFVFSGAECQEWMQQAGFSQSQTIHLKGPDWMVVGIK